MLLIGLCWPQRRRPPRMARPRQRRPAGAAGRASRRAPPAGSEVPPELQVTPQQGQATSPEVTIHRHGTDTLEEYSIQGRVYKIQVRPQVGPAYYIVDNDGDGSFEPAATTSRTRPVPQWVLIRF